MSFLWSQIPGAFYSATFPDITSLWLCLSLITNDVERPFMCLCVSSIFSLVMGLIKLFPKLYIPYFLNEFSVLLYVLMNVCMNSHFFMICKYFLQLQLSFHYVNSIF